MNFGYAIASMDEPELQMQLGDLGKSGCESIIIERKYQISKKPPEFQKLVSRLSSGDTITVCRLSNLGREPSELIKLMVQLNRKGVCFRSLFEGIDTSDNSWSKWYFFCRVLMEGGKQVKRGSKPIDIGKIEKRSTKGRPPGLSSDAKVVAEMLLILHEAGRNVSDIRKALNIASFDTFYKYLAYAKRENLKSRTVAVTLVLKP